MDSGPSLSGCNAPSAMVVFHRAEPWSAAGARRPAQRANDTCEARATREKEASDCLSIFGKAIGWSAVRPAQAAREAALRRPTSPPESLYLLSCSGTQQRRKQRPGVPLLTAGGGTTEGAIGSARAWARSPRPPRRWPRPFCCLLAEELERDVGMRRQQCGSSAAAVLWRDLANGCSCCACSPLPLAPPPSHPPSRARVQAPAAALCLHALLPALHSLSVSTLPRTSPSPPRQPSSSPPPRPSPLTEEGGRPPYAASAFWRPPRLQALSQRSPTLQGP